MLLISELSLQLTVVYRGGRNGGSCRMWQQIFFSGGMNGVGSRCSGIGC